jgi:hypothetical protein
MLPTNPCRAGQAAPHGPRSGGCVANAAVAGSAARIGQRRGTARSGDWSRTGQSSRQRPLPKSLTPAVWTCEGKGVGGDSGDV